MKVSDFNYPLPPELIAQTPMEPRDHSRLMVLHRADRSIEHTVFYRLEEYLNPGDVLVFNDSRVLRARLFGRRADGARIEILLLRPLGDRTWQVMTRPGKKTPLGTVITIPDETAPRGEQVAAEVIAHHADGTRNVRFSSESPLERLGKAPLPPYIKAPLADPERYQTVYARVKGSAAAPTAGLHFTPELLKSLQEKGVRFAFVTLHIGLDTFQPVRVEEAEAHHIHSEYGEVSAEACDNINQARREGRRIVAVGTTSTRLLEAAASSSGMAPAGDGTAMTPLKPYAGWVDLYILPGYRFKLVDAMVTNFHLPRSTLLMLVSAFAGRDFIRRAYDEAREKGYRFYSFGDAMLIVQYSHAH